MHIEVTPKQMSRPRKERLTFVQFRLAQSTRKAIDKICKDAGMSRSHFFRALIQATIRGDVTVKTSISGEVV